MECVGISIVLPVFNVEKYIDECINSILNQKFEDFEIICVLDTNKDSSADKIKAYAKADERIKIVHQENNGLSSARNIGTKKAMGEYVWFVDSDDYIADESLGKIWSFVKKYDLDMLAFQTNVIYSDDIAENIREQTDENFKQVGKYIGVQTGVDILSSMVKYGDYTAPVWLFVTKREFLNTYDIRFEEGIYAEDHIYGLLCYVNAKRVMYVPEKFYSYRVRTDSLSQFRRTGHALYSYLKIYDLIKKLLMAHWDSEKTRAPLLKITQNTLLGIKRLNRAMSKEEKKKYIPPDDYIDLIFREMSVGPYSDDDFDIVFYMNAFVSKIQAYEQATIYGAGKIGQLCYKFLTKKGLAQKVAFFTVTDKKETDDFLLGKKILSLEEALNTPNFDKMLLVIAVGNLLRKELEQNCQNKKIKNILSVDAVMRSYMENSLSDQYR